MKISSLALILLTLLCIALSIFIVTQLPCKCPEQSDFGMPTIRYLETENDSLLKNNQLLDKKISRWQRQTDSLRQSLIITKNTIQQLKQHQHENISRIDSLNSMELYGFFSKFNP